MPEVLLEVIYGCHTGRSWSALASKGRRDQVRLSQGCHSSQATEGEGGVACRSRGAHTVIVDEIPLKGGTEGGRCSLAAGCPDPTGTLTRLQTTVANLTVAAAY